MSINIATAVSPEEYLARERAAETKHEWIDGEVREMAGGSRGHNVIMMNLLRILGNGLEDQPRELYPGDMRVRIPDGPYYYPDAVIAPKSPRFEEDQQPDTLLNPCVIFEVLSPSTESIDRGEKLDNYRRIPSLTDYLLVAQKEIRIDHYRRDGDQWPLEILTEPGGSLRLPEIGCELPLEAIYRRVISAK